VRASDAAILADVLASAGASVRLEADGALAVTGLSATRVSELAMDRRIPLSELATRSSSLEEAFMHVTAESVEYLGGDVR
jgi:ABC-2 type transport system ATP-binding protein